MTLKAHEVVEIEYTKATNLGNGSAGEVTERAVIPTFVPPRSMKAVDVTALTEDARAIMADRLKEYAEYYQQRAKLIFSFEDWLAQTYNESADDVKWRTFVIENTKVLD